MTRRDIHFLNGSLLGAGVLYRIFVTASSALRVLGPPTIYINLNFRCAREWATHPKQVKEGVWPVDGHTCNPKHLSSPQCSLEACLIRLGSWRASCLHTTLNVAEVKVSE